MGWKSTITLTREKAIQLIVNRALTATNDELGNALESLGFGDDTNLSHYGHNFSVVDKEETKDRGSCEECGEGLDNEEEWKYNTECAVCGHPIPESKIIKPE